MREAHTVHSLFLHFIVAFVCIDLVQEILFGIGDHLDLVIVIDEVPVFFFVGK